MSCSVSPFRSQRRDESHRCFTTKHATISSVQFDGYASYVLAIARGDVTPSPRVAGSLRAPPEANDGGGADRSHVVNSVPAAGLHATLMRRLNRPDVKRKLKHKRKKWPGIWTKGKVGISGSSSETFGQKSGTCSVRDTLRLGSRSEFTTQRRSKTGLDRKVENTGTGRDVAEQTFHKLSRAWTPGSGTEKEGSDDGVMTAPEPAGIGPIDCTLGRSPFADMSSGDALVSGYHGRKRLAFPSIICASFMCNAFISSPASS